MTNEVVFAMKLRVALGTDRVSWFSRLVSRCKVPVEVTFSSECTVTARVGAAKALIIEVSRSNMGKCMITTLMAFAADTALPQLLVHLPNGRHQDFWWNIFTSGKLWRLHGRKKCAADIFGKAWIIQES